jgi:hypothetical protein
MRNGAKQLSDTPIRERMMHRGHYDCTVEDDDDMRDFQQVAERNGSMLDWTFDQEKNDCAYVCTKMTRQEWQQYVEWEKEE